MEMNKLTGKRKRLLLKKNALWAILKVFIEFVTIFLLFHVLDFWPRGKWNLNSPTRDQTCTPCIGRWGLNTWATREIPKIPCIKRTSCYCAFACLWASLHCTLIPLFLGLPGGSDGKETACSAGDPGLTPGLGKFPWRMEWLTTLVLS